MLGNPLGVVGIKINTGSMYSPNLGVDPEKFLAMWAYWWDGSTLVWEEINDPGHREGWMATCFHAEPTYSDKDLAAMFMGAPPPPKKLKPDFSGWNFEPGWLLSAMCEIENKLGRVIPRGTRGVVKLFRWEDVPSPHVGVIFENGVYFITPLTSEIHEMFGQFRPGPKM